MKKIVLLIFLFPFILLAQDPYIDSLKLELKNAKHDTTKVKLLLELSEVCEVKNILEFADPCVTICKINLAKVSSQNNNTSLFYLKHLSGALTNIGVKCSDDGDIDRALECHQKALTIYTETNNKLGMANSFINLGSDYSNIGDTRLTLEFLFKGLKIYEEIDNNNGIANALNNISVVYRSQKDYQKAIEYCKRSLILHTKTNNKKGIGYALSNLGSYYDDLHDTHQALEYYNKSLKVQEESNNKYGIAYSLNNIGSMYSRMKDLQSALNYYNSCLVIYNEISDKVGITMALNNKGRALFGLGNLVEASTIAKQSMQIAKELGNPDRIKHSASTLREIYIKQNKFKEALEMYELEIQMRDSTINEETKKASTKKQFQYEYEKKAAADSVKHTEEQKVKNAQLKAQQAQLKQEKTQRLALYGGLVLVIVFLGFVFNRFKVTQKQKIIIEQQKVLVDGAFAHLEEKNKEVLDSIHYAKRIQTALLTSEKYIERKLKELN